MKDIVLKITGRQYIGTNEEDSVEFVTDGKYYESDGKVYIEYTESELSGIPGCITTVKLDGDTISLNRLGSDSGGYDSVMEFRIGDRFQNQYDTPYGPLNMEVVTKKIVNDLDENGSGVIEIEYGVCIGSFAETVNGIRIEIDAEPQK